VGTSSPYVRAALKLCHRPLFPAAAVSLRQDHEIPSRLATERKPCPGCSREAPCRQARLSLRPLWLRAGEAQRLPGLPAPPRPQVGACARARRAPWPSRARWRTPRRCPWADRLSGSARAWAQRARRSAGRRGTRRGHGGVERHLIVGESVGLEARSEGGKRGVVA